MSEEILVVGAGPTGLTLAIELKRFGLPVRLIDKNDHPALYSQALVVQARTLEQFERYGIAEQAVAQGRPLREGKFWSEGKLVAAVQLSRIPGRFPFALVLPQNETERILMDHLHSLGGEVERQIELLSYENKDRGVSATLKHADGQTEQASFRWIVGCDGAHSAVRRLTNIPFEGDTVAMLFTLGDLHLSGEDTPGDELSLHWHHGGDVLFIAKLKDNLYRVIVITRLTSENEKNHVPTIDEFNATFARFGMKMTAHDSVWSAPFHVNERRAERYREGNVFLAGDASHIHSPAGGQGMNTGIQDSANLAWKLAAVANGGDPGILDSYTDERGAVGKGVLRASSFGLRVATAGSTLVEHIRDFAIHYVLQLGVVQDAATKIISETGIQYRDSPIVVDDAHGGPLRAGDRMPDADGPGGTTLLAPLLAAKHLLVAVDVTAKDVPRDLLNTSVLELASDAQGWAPALKELLGKGPMLYLVRPDGYVGYRGAGMSESLREYARRMGLVRAT